MELSAYEMETSAHEMELKATEMELGAHEMELSVTPTMPSRAEGSLERWGTARVDGGEREGQMGNQTIVIIDSLRPHPGAGPASLPS